MTAELIARWSGGELDLMGWNESDHGDFLIETLADGTEWGNPEPVRRALRRFLLDGSASVKEYDDNRTITLSHRVSAPDGVALAAGESALAQLDDRSIELVWTPPDAFAVPAVFVAVSADLRHKMDDLRENHAERFYTLTLDALPHAYSDAYVEVEALPQDISVRTEFDDCTVLTGWTSAGVTIYDGGDYIAIDYGFSVASGTVTRTGVVDFTTARYLAVEQAASYGGVGFLVAVDVQVAGSWVSAPRVGTDAGDALFDVGTQVVDAIRFSFERPHTYDPDEPVAAMAFDSLGKQSTVRTGASNDQVRTISVPGSRRSPASVELVANTGTLGDVIVYNGPDYDPSMALRIGSGAPGNFVSTPPSPDEPETFYRFPISELPPGEYVAWADVNVSTNGTATAQFKGELWKPGGVAAARSEVLADYALVHGTLGPVPLFAATLPGWDVPAGAPHDFVLRVTLTLGTATAASFNWSNLWLFNVSDGNLTVLKAGADTKAWLEPASLDRDHASVWVGDSTLPEALPVSLAADLPAWGGSQYVTPGVTTLYTWSSDSTDASVSARFRPAWHTHPAS